MAEEGLFFEDADGNRQYVVKSNLPAAAASGLALVPGQAVTFTDATSGKRSTVSGENFVTSYAGDSSIGIENQATVQGLVNKRRSSEIYGGGLNQVAAGAAGVARGLTLGASDALLTGLDIVDSRDLAGIRNEHQTTSLLGELGGAIIPGLLTGGAGAAGSLARLMPAGQLAFRTGRVAEALGGLRGGMAAAGIEGAVFGAAQGVSNIALADEPLAAEAAFKEIGMNALYGTAFGAGGALAGAGMAKLGNAVKQNLVKRTAPFLDLASTEGRALQSTLKLHADDVDDIAELVFAKAEQRSSTGFRHAFDDDVAEASFTALQRQKSAALEHVSAMSSTSRLPAAVTKAAAKVEVVEGKIAAMFKGKRGPVNFSIGGGFKQSQLAQVGKLYDDLGSSVATLSEAAGVPMQALAQRPVSSQIVQGIEGIGDLTATARAARGEYLTKLGDSKGSMSALFKQEPAEAFATLKALDTSNRRMMELAEAVGGKEGGKLKAATDGLSEAVQGASKKAGSTLPPAAELALAFGVEEAVPDFDGPMDDILKLYLASRAMGKFGRSGGLASKAMQALERKIPGGKAAAVATGYVSDSIGKLASAAGSSINRIQSGLARSLETGGQAIRRTSPLAAQVLGAVSFGEDSEPTAETSTALGSFRARSRELSGAVANMAGTEAILHERLAGVRQVSEGVGDKVVGHAKATLEYLHEKMPKDPGVLQSFGVSKWRPTEDQLDKWARYVHAAQDPAGIVERFGEGSMTREDAETLRNLYPAHFAQVQGWVMDNLPAMQKQHSYERRIQTSVLLGVNADPIMARASAWQDSFAEPEQPEQRMQVDSKSQPTTAQKMQEIR